MNSNPKISIIVPVYNVEQYLPRCIDRILNQFFIDFDGNLKDAAVQNALRGLKEETLDLKIFGNY